MRCLPRRCVAWLVAAAGAGLTSWALAQSPTVASAAQAAALPAAATVLGAGQVVVSGTVPDEATRVAILNRARELYGSDRVVDRLLLGAVVAPPQWSQYVHKLLSPQLKQVRHGQLTVQGQTIELKGEVPNEAVRQEVASQMASSLNPTYTVRNGLRVAVREQAVVDQTLANRIIEFEPGSAVLRPEGALILDELARTLLSMGERRLEVIGHTDAQGSRASNLALSLARAQAVKSYLVNRGLVAERIATSGMGPDQPAADNTTEAGRARNRRIEFRVGA
ncbi:MAG: OmpA family protein [Aquabacterium sp.]